MGDQQRQLQQIYDACGTAHDDLQTSYVSFSSDYEYRNGVVDDSKNGQLHSGNQEDEQLNANANGSASSDEQDALLRRTNTPCHAPATQIPRPERAKQRKTCGRLSRQDVFIVAYVLFCVHFGFSTGNVFVTPFLIKAGVNDFLSTFVWAVPTLLDVALRPFARYALQSGATAPHRRRRALIASCGASACGLLALAVSTTTPFATLLAVIGFVVSETGQIVCEDIINAYAKDSVRKRDEVMTRNLLLLADGLGKISAYLLASLQAFQVLHVHDMRTNMRISYALACLLFLGAAVALAQTRFEPEKAHFPRQTYYSLRDMFQHAQYLLAGPRQSVIDLWQNEDKSARMVVLSHFLSTSGTTLISVYATLWTGVSVLQSAIQKHHLDTSLREYFLDLGVSWGALTLALSSFFYLFTSVAVWGARSPNDATKSVFAVSNMVAGAALAVAYACGAVRALVFVLPVWGIALGSARAARRLHPIVWDKYAYLSTYASRLVLFVLIPSVYFVFQRLDDINTSFTIASAANIAGGAIAWWYM